MTFDAYDRSRQLLRALAILLKRMSAHDTELTKQLRRAAESVHLNIAEANCRVGKDRANRFRMARASAAEVSAALEGSLDLGYLQAAEVAHALDLADRIRAMTYRLSIR